MAAPRASALITGFSLLARRGCISRHAQTTRLIEPTCCYSNRQQCILKSRFSTDTPRIGASMERFMDQRVALVTGSTSGIGLGIARGLAARGCAVVLNGFGDPELIQSIQDEFASKYKSRVDYVAADLTKPDEVTAMCGSIRDIYPKGLDIIVNNAGFQHVSPVEDFPLDKWDDLIAVLLSAPFHIIKNFVSDMKGKGWGRIINIASVHGLVASPNKAAYVSAKHGIVGLTKVLALETAGSGVTCNSICPGFVDTPILQGQVQTLADKEGLSYKEAKGKFLANYHPSKDSIGIDQLAETVAFMCSDAASQMTGSSMVLDGGWTAK